MTTRQRSHPPLRVAVVGAGPNGLVAAAVLGRAGCQVTVLEAAARLGGAARSSTEPLGGQAVVDLGAAGHPFGVMSPAFRDLDLTAHGLQWAHATYPLAHPLEDQPAALLRPGLAATAQGLGIDAQSWRQLHGPVVRDIDKHIDNLLAPPLRVPPHPLSMARFGVRAPLPAHTLAHTIFRQEAARALLVGSAVHSISSPRRPLTSAFGVLFGAMGMAAGWPVARGGTQAVVDSLVSVTESFGVELHTNNLVEDARQLRDFDAVILNLTPRQVMDIRGLDLPASTRRRLGKWRYGPGVFKVDYLLEGPVPWEDPAVGRAGTVHVCGSANDIASAEAQVEAGVLPTRPFVMVCQQQLADPTRARSGHVIWAYAHVPHGYREKYPGEVGALIDAQLERFAPGFRGSIIRRSETSPQGLAEWNPNIVGGDIAGGAMTGSQMLLRPGLSRRPHRIAPNVYLASGATPPGAGVHGMAGWHAAHNLLHEHGFSQ